MPAPFSGTIARVDVKSFAQIAAGQPVLSLFSDDGFEISFLAPSGIFRSLKVGQPVDVTVADLPELRLQGRVERSSAHRPCRCSAFPAVVRLDNDVAGLNAGMAVEVAVEAPLIGGSGFLLPLSALVPKGGKVCRPPGVCSVTTKKAQA